MITMTTTITKTTKTYSNFHAKVRKETTEYRKAIPAIVQDHRITPGSIGVKL